MTLDIIGKVDQFGGVFDIEDFKKHRAEAYFEILKTKDGDAKEDNAVFAKDLYRMAKEKDLILQASTVLYRLYIIFGVGKLKRGINRIRYRMYDILLSRPKLKRAIKRILNRT